MRRVSLSLLLLVGTLLAFFRPAAAQETEDPYLWLEEVEGERALAWVEERSSATLAELRRNPQFEVIFNDALEILTSDERIPFPRILGDKLYNFWQDAEHERGIWRRTTWESYLSADPGWETVLDIDSLAAAEEVNWTFGGATCLPPEHRLCMVELSRGGADASEAREFDAVEKRFVAGGFFLPEAKSSLTWRGPDALLVTTDFGEGSLTTSGYPRVAKLWRRGTSLENAEVLFEGDSTDVGVWAYSIETPNTMHHLISRSPSFFETITQLLGEDGELTRLDLPLDARLDIVGDQLVVYLRSLWEVRGRTYTEGSLIAIGLDAFLSGARDFQVVVEPGPRATIEDFTSTREDLLVNILDNVNGQLWLYGRHDGEWVADRVPAPDFGSVSVVSTDAHEPRYFFSFSGYTQPNTLYVAEPCEEVRAVRRMPEMFDAQGLVVEQFEATSDDGTTVPYFLVHREDLELDGESPTLLYSYGGFQIALLPSYNPVVGKAWLERGGVYAVANIRGGGEFGPAWWKAAQKENRQQAYDDFLAVAEDLIERGVTSPEHLGIHGGSNGGLLVGVAMTQRPELFDAVVAEVPLLDMRRYNKLLAGASWMAEYGDPDKAEEWAYIRRYSPYQNVAQGVEYPRALFYTTTRDDRVHPGHARKMAARMESMGHSVYYYENTEGGHGRAVTPTQRARMYAIEYTYLWNHLGEEERAVSR
ncbi:MAG: prolyl oligopeptidase family protein [Gemmatimonadota bacterium]